MRNVRMIQACQDLRLTLEPRHPAGVLGKLLRQHLERHLAAELFIGGSPNLPHPAGAKRRSDAVLGNSGADHFVPF
jgi:hypothetical protein